MLVTLCALLGFAAWFVPPVYKLRHGPVVVTRYAKKRGATKATVGPGLGDWIPIGKVSKHLLHAIIAAEDGHFYEHHGLDFNAIKQSYELNKRKKRYVRGGSTLSQQVVKMAFLGREKTLIRKAREAVGTLLMELILPKDKILEWYINMAEFGDGVYGVRQGCWHYFRTKPELLTIEQSVHLALVLPSPNAWSRGLRARHLTPFGHRRFAAILNTMRGMGYVTRPQWVAAVTRGDFGRPIAGYAALLAAEEGNQTLCPGSPGCPETADDEGPEDEDGDDQNAAPNAAPKAGAAPATGTATATAHAVAAPAPAPPEDDPEADFDAAPDPAPAPPAAPAPAGTDDETF